MESSAMPDRTVLSAFPAYKWITDQTDQVVAKLTDELAAWRPEMSDGSWHFSLGEIVAHIADAAYMFHGMLTGEDYDDTYFMKPPEDFEGGQVEWKVTREFNADDVKAHLKAVREKWVEVLAWPIEKAYEPTDATMKQFEEMKEKDDSDEFHKAHLIHGPSTALRVITTLVAHEAGHRSSMITLMRVHHGISFEEKKE